MLGDSKISLERTAPSSKKDWGSMSVKELSAYFREQIATDEAWCCRAIVAVYENQTAEEKSKGDTISHNGIGFSGTDAKLLSSFAEQIMRRQAQGYKAGLLSQKQLVWAFKLMPKYAGQLAKLVWLDSQPDPALARPSKEEQWQDATSDAIHTEIEILEQAADLAATAEVNRQSLLTCYMRDIVWNNTDRTAVAYEIPLHLDKLGWPDILSAIAPSGLSMATFFRTEIHIDHDRDKIVSCVYIGVVEGKQWTLIVLEGDKPGPDWSQYPEGTRELFEEIRGDA